MRTFKLLALVAMLGLASLASAQTLTRSLLLKPAGAIGTLTLTTGAVTALQSYQITLPTIGASLQGPIVKTSTATGDKTWTFGQIDLTSNAGSTGDITGTLGVSNGGTGLNNAPVNSILYASAANTYSSLSPGTTGQVLGNNSGVPTWGTTLGGAGATTNVSNAGAGNTTNINGPTATGGSVTIGNATSTNSIVGTTTFTGTVNIPLTTDYIWRGVGGISTPYAPGTAGQVLSIVGTTPTWSTTLGGGGVTTNINNSGAGNTTNINAGGTGGTTTIGNATSTTVINGSITLPLATNNVWTGVANVATPLAPTASSIFVTAGAGNVVPQWSTTLPSGLTIPSATITNPTLTGGTIDNTVIGGTTPAAATFTNLTAVGTINLNQTGTGTTTIGNAAGPSTTSITGNVTFPGAAGTVSFTNMPNLPLPTNNMYVGNPAGNAQAYATTAERVLTSPGGVPTWSTTLPSAVTVPFDQISSGTNTTATMTVGTGASLVPGGTGIITATRFTGSGSTTNAVDLATAEVSGVLPIANGGTNSSTIGAAGTVSYSTGTAYASTAAGTSGQILQSNGAGAPSWVNVGNLLAAASFSVTADAADVTNGYFLINVTEVPTLLTGYGYDASARVMVTLETASGPGQVVTVTNRGAADFRVYTGAIGLGDVINVVIIDTTP